MLTITNPKNFDWASMSLADCCEGNAADSYFTLKLFDLVVNSETKLKELDRELSNLIVNQEDGLYVYKELLNTDNLASNNDLTDIFYTREGGFELYPPDKTGSGKPSVSAPTLKILLEQINTELANRA